MSIFDILPWWTWAIGTFGVLGLIALVFLAPVLAGKIFGFVLNRLAAALRTPLGAGLIVGAIALGLGYLWGGTRAEHRCNAAIEQMKVDAADAAKARDAAIKAKIESQFSPIVDALKQRSDGLQQQVDDYERQIASKPANSRCALGAQPLRLRPR